MSETNGLIIELMERLHLEGVPMAVIGDMESRLVNELERARRITRAASMLPLIGAEAVAERLGCSRRTVYNLVHRHRAKVVQENEKACANS
jgi:hypothetical protein